MKRLVTHRFSYIVPAGKKRSTPDGPATAARRGASRLPRSADRSVAIPGSYACLEAVRCAEKPLLTEKPLLEDAPGPRPPTVSARGTPKPRPGQSDRRLQQRPEHGDERRTRDGQPIRLLLPQT